MTNVKTGTTATKELAQSRPRQEDSRYIDLQIRALGRWNEQMTERVITRQNGYASYSLLKLMMSRDLGA